MRASTFLVALMVGLAGISHGETLREVLQQKQIPLNAFSEPELATPVAAGRTAELGDAVALVYPTLGKADALAPPFHIVRYERATEKLIRRLIYSTQRASDPQAEISDLCFAPVLGLSAQDDNLLFTTRIDSSAGCTVVLNPELWVTQTVMGWPMAKLGASRVLVQENMVHAAAIHSARLEILDLITGGLKEVYPPERDPLRWKFLRELRQHAPAGLSCAACDPQPATPESAKPGPANPKTSGSGYRPFNPRRFNDDVPGPVATNPAGSVFAFVATFDASGFGEPAESAVGKRYVLYVYRRQLDLWNFCQQEISDLELPAVKNQLQSDLEGVAQRCHAERPVKVAPRESPFAKYEKSRE